MNSLNQEHFGCFNEVKPLLKDRPLVLDREFSYQVLIKALTDKIKSMSFCCPLLLSVDGLTSYVAASFAPRFGRHCHIGTAKRADSS